MSCELKARLTTFVDETSWSRDITTNAKDLDTCLEDLFAACRVEICKRADACDQVPYRIVLQAACEAIDDKGNVIKDRTPRGLFELFSREERVKMKKRNRKGLNNGHA